jgi:hypothetical protein
VYNRCCELFPDFSTIPDGPVEGIDLAAWRTQNTENIRTLCERVEINLDLTGQKN